MLLTAIMMLVCAPRAASELTKVERFLCEAPCLCQLSESIERSSSELRSQVEKLREDFKVVENAVSELRELHKDPAGPKDCEELHESNSSLPNGVYEIFPVYNGEEKPMSMYCDMEGGAWTVLLQRLDGSVDFDITFNEMKSMVGSFSTDFWVGLLPGHYLTSSDNYTLMVELWSGVTKYVSIRNGFKIGDEASNFTLTSGTWDQAESNVSYNAMEFSDGAQFSTKDWTNNAANCVERSGGPGWFISCTFANVFGPFRRSPSNDYMYYYYFDDEFHEPSALTLKVRRTAP